MKRFDTKYVKSVQSIIKDIEVDQVAKAINDSNLPIHMQRSRSFGSLQNLKWLAVPILGALAVGGYAVYRGLKSREEVKAWLNARWVDTRPQDAEAETPQKEQVDEMDAVAQASQDTLPGSESPAWATGSDDPGQHSKRF